MRSHFSSFGIINSLLPLGLGLIFCGQAMGDENTFPPNGKVGIGTTDPRARLQVGNVGAANPSFSALFDHALGVSNARDFPGDRRYAYIHAFPASNTYGLNAYDYANNTPLPITIGWSGAHDILLAPQGGNVGIGTTDPTFGKLDVRSDTSATVNVKTNNSTSFSRFLVQNDLSASASYSDLIIYGSASSFSLFGLPAANRAMLYSAGGSSEGLLVGTHTAKPLIFGTSNAERMRIDSIGNVGIGTTDPNERLHVDGNIFVSGGKIRGHSDLRLKKNILPMTGVLQKLDKLQAVTFDWKDPAKPGKQYGVIAQEVETVFPELVATHSDGFKSVDYLTLVVPLLAASKDLSKENAILKGQLLEQGTKISKQESKIEALESLVRDLSAQKQKLADLEKLIKSNSFLTTYQPGK